MGRKCLAVIFMAFCLFSGCGPTEKQTETDSPEQIDVSGSSKESIYFNSYRRIAASPDGYYVQEAGKDYLAYIGKDGMRETYLCSKPDCSHVDDSAYHGILKSCDAYIGSTLPATVQWYNGNVYLLEYNELNYDVTLVRISEDGSVHEQLMKIGQSPSRGSSYKYVFADEDTIYMTYDDPETYGKERSVSLSKVDLKTKEITDVYTCSGPNVRISYGMMVLNRNLFFMQVTMNEEDVYQQYLMRYNMDSGKTEIIIEESINSYTLVGNGRLVYFIPKDGLYLYDMETTKAEKIRQCDNETMYVNLAWDGTYLYLDNFENSMFFEQGEHKIFVCTLDGEVINEILGDVDYVDVCDGDYMFIRTYVNGEGMFWSYMKSSEITNPRAEWTVLILE